MDEFKPASTLYEDQSKGHPPTRGSPPFKATKSKTRKCEQHKKGICEASMEAVNLGLAEKLFPCTGNIPPDCKIRQDLAAGKTIQEIYQK